jgi:putative hydrolase of the HAD superfamily
MKTGVLFHHTRTLPGGTLGVSAVVFDYGMVLTGPQDPAAYAALLRITGLDAAGFEAVYWADRHAYDEGKFTGILSNMGDSVHENIEREFRWLARLDALVWSYQLRIAKPDPAIFHYVLQKLGTRPEQTLFIDDKRVNVDAAVALGMKGLVFTDVTRLRADLVAEGLDAELPLP